MTARVITVGNATIDAFLSLKNSGSLHEDHGQLCVPLGAKIELDRYDLLPGGNACNVAVGLSRLGISSGLCAEIGDDELSEKILKSLYKEEVDFHLVKRSKKEPTSFAVALNLKAERTLFVSHVVRDHEFGLPDNAPEWFYITSLGEKWQQAYERILEYAIANKVSIAFSPGGHQLMEKTDIVGKILEHTDILFVNKEEATAIFNLKFKIYNEKENDKVENLLKQMKSLGPKMVVITDGKNGSSALDSGGTVHTFGIVEAPIVEKTGAGDAYASGFLGAIILGKTIPESMEWGAVNASSVIGQIGAQEGLLRKII